MNWRDIGPTTFEAFEAEIRSRAPRSPLLAEVRAIYDAVRDHSRLFLGMCWIEDRFNTDPSDNFPITNRNLMNMKTPDGSGWMKFDSYAAGSKGWLDRITSPTYKNGIYAKTETVEDLVMVYAPPYDSNDVPNYVATIGVIVDELKALEADQSPTPTPTPSPGGNDVPTYTTTVPGLPGGPLTTTYPIRFNMTAIDGYQRTGQKARTPRRSIQHGTDNPNNQSAWQEAQYFVNGAEGRQASVHSFADDNEVVIGMPLDEVAWQAADGSGPGNMNGFACEMMEATAIWNNTARRNKLVAIAADWMGRVSARFGVTKPERHWDFNAGSADRHHCPNLLMNTGLWDSMYVPMWQAARADELARMTGDTPTTTTTAPPPPPSKYVAPDVPDFVAGDVKLGYPRNHAFKNTTAYACLREWTVKKATPRRLTSTRTSKEVGEPLKAGAKFPGWYIFKSGTSWWILTQSGTRVDMADMTDRVTVTEKA